MCGITGFIDFNKSSSEEILKQMVKVIDHRGPDDSGAELIVTREANLGFGQSRLSIIDLSEAGHQPMHFEDLTIVFNGEIYNYKEIKEELITLGHIFISNSDTEVILHAMKEWGDKAVNKFIGMFSFVLFSHLENTVKIFRDRPGVKPLYYSYKNGIFLFGSELKSLMAHPSFDKTINKSVLPQYLNLEYISAPDSIFLECKKVMPGHCVILDLSNKEIKTIKYWDVSDYYKESKLDISYEEAKSELHNLLISSFQYRMVADVPVGVFLSGGYDSTAVAAILQANSSQKLRTFTIGFEEGNNEAPFASQTAQALGTDHTEYICTSKEAQSIVLDLPFFFDEPFGDSSAIPTTLVSQVAVKEVTVALSADGGDEIFAGYGSYFSAMQLNEKLNKVPNILKSYLSRFNRLVKDYGSFLEPSLQHKAASAFESLDTDSKSQFYKLYKLMREKPKSYINAFFTNQFQSAPSAYEFDYNGFHDDLDIALVGDYKSYLQDDILTKVDRATMSVSLEGREPLLDHRIVEFAARLPINFKYGGGNNGKIILKDIVHEYLPKEMMDRPKAGFSLPIYSWLRKDLSYLIDEYLSEESLGWSGIWNVPFVYSQVKLFKDRKLHYTPVIWYLLMFQMWWKRWMM